MENDSFKEDYSNPLFVDESDWNNRALISEPLTGSSNYNTWSNAMLEALAKKNKVGFVDGSLPRPDASNSHHLFHWVSCNILVRYWLYNSISREILPSIQYSDPPSEIWKDLKDRFEPKGPRTFRIRKKLTILVQGSNSITNYFINFQTTWTNLRIRKCTINCTCGALSRLGQDWEFDYVIYFLLGLNDSFSDLRHQILLMNPIPDIIGVLKLLYDEEEKRMGNGFYP